MAYVNRENLNESENFFSRESIEGNNYKKNETFLESSLSVSDISSDLIDMCSSKEDHKNTCSPCDKTEVSTGYTDGRDRCSTGREQSSEMLRSSRSPVRSQHVGEPSPGQQYTRTPTWTPCRGNIGFGEPPRLELGVPHPGASVSQHVLVLTDPRLWDSPRIQPRTSEMPKQSDQQLSDTNSQLGGLLSPPFRAMQPVWGQLLPVYEQLHPPPNNGILSALQQGNGSLSLPLQGELSRSVSENNELPKQSEESPLGEQEIENQRWVIHVKNIVGEKRSIEGSPEKSLRDICTAVRICPKMISIPGRSEMIDLLRNVYIIYNGRRYEPNGSWESIGIKNNEVVHVLRSYDTEERRYLSDQDKIKREKKFRERCKYSQTEFDRITEKKELSLYEQFREIRLEIKIFFCLVFIHIIVNLFSLFL